MAKWLLVLGTLVLAGCSSPSAPGESSSAGTAVDLAPSSDASQDVLQFDGSILGVGFWTDATGGFFAGTFTVSDVFAVRDNATRLRFDLTWDHPVPHAIWLHYVTPEPWGEAVEATPEEMLAGALSTTIEAPMAGTWEVTARATGLAAEVPYHITVTIDYASP